MRLSYITLGEEKRPVCFSLSAIEKIQEEFGGLDQMRAELTDGKISAIIKVIDIMLAAGEAYCRGMDLPCPPPLKCRPGDLIDVSDNEIVHDIFAAMSNDAKRTVETKDSKN